MKTFVSTFELSSKAGLSWDGCDLAEQVYNRACCDAETLEEAYENIYYALDYEMIYTYRQWQIMQEYQTPSESNYNKAYDSFLCDLQRYFYDCVSVDED